MTYYCQLRLSVRDCGGYRVLFPDIDTIFTQGRDKDHALSMATEALNGRFECDLEDSSYIPLPIDRSDEGLFPIDVDPKIAKRILESKIKVLQKELRNLENDVEISPEKIVKAKTIKTPLMSH